MANDKLSRFADVLLEEADEKKRKIENELNEKKQSQLNQTDKELNDCYNSSVYVGKYKIMHQKQVYLTGRESELRRMLLKNRQRNFNIIFKEAEERIRNFTKTPEYEKTLTIEFAKAVELFNVNTSNLTCKVMEKDIILAKKIFNMPNIEIMKTDTDFIGGFTLESSDSNIFVDCTLRTKLNEQMKEFYKTSGLTLEM